MITIEPCEFHVRGIVSYGFLIHDDHDTCFETQWDDLPDDDAEVLAKVIKLSSINFQYD